MDESRASGESGGPAGVRRGRPRMPALLIVLTVVTGLIEAVSLLALGPVFTAMQTGNVLFLSFGAARAGNLPALVSAVSLAAFAVGAVCGAHLESVAEGRGRRWFVIGLLAESGLILLAAALGWGLAPRYGVPTARHMAVTAALALAMGMRNATIMRANVPGVPTTLVTRSMTAFLGGSAIGQGNVFGSGRSRWELRGLTVLAMFAGGFLGALLVRAEWTVGWLLLPAAVTVLAVGLAYLGQPWLHTGSGTGRERSR